MPSWASKITLKMVDLARSDQPRGNAFVVSELGLDFFIPRFSSGTDQQTNCRRSVVQLWKA